MESMAYELDGGQELGWVFNHIIRPMQNAGHYEIDMLEVVAEKLKKLDFGHAWRRDLERNIPQGFLRHPYTKELFTGKEFKKKDVIQIMMNLGNASNT